MPIALILLGIVIASATVNDQLGALGTQAKTDLFGVSGGKVGFIEWAAAILVVGALFRAVDLPDAGKALVALIILAFLLGNTGVPMQFLAGLQAVGGKATPPQTPADKIFNAAGAPAAPVAPTSPAAPNLGTP